MIYIEPPLSLSLRSFRAHSAPSPTCPALRLTLLYPGHRCHTRLVTVCHCDSDICMSLSQGTAVAPQLAKQAVARFESVLQCYRGTFSSSAPCAGLAAGPPVLSAGQVLLLSRGSQRGRTAPGLAPAAAS